MHIVLFGGAFDPPQLGHQQVTKALLASPGIDEVWYVPVKQHPFGKQLQTTDHHRLAMLQLIQVPRTRLETFEFNHDEASLSYITLRTLSTEHPEHSFSWVIGSDNLAEFHKWDFYEQILSEFGVYVYPRAGFPLQPLYEGMIPMEHMPEVAISSTDVRARLAAGHPIETLVDPQVAAYIADNHLYR